MDIGTLCGHCINGTGVGVLRTNCRECTKDNYFALGFLGLSNIKLLLSLIVFYIIIMINVLSTCILAWMTCTCCMMLTISVHLLYFVITLAYTLV